MKAQRIGTMTIDKVLDFDHSAWPASKLFPGVTAEILDSCRSWLPPGSVHSEQDIVYLSFHSYVLRTPDHVVVIDTCVGNCKERRSLESWNMLQTPYLAELASIGLSPGDVDIVLCTHLHADHVGWNTRLINGQWLPTFPKARYVMARKELAHWQALHAANPVEPVTRGAFVDSVLPVIESGQALIVESDHVLEGAIGEGIWLTSSPGHSPGHVCVRAQHGDQLAIFSGDVVHSPIQFAFPDLCSAADIDREQSRNSRRALFEHIADTPALLFPAHFAAPSACQVVRHADTFRPRMIGH